ncbi:MAG: TIGR02281 family clan AA aspartic protease, partial [Gammaproteobacteria bacterium]
MNKSGRSKNMPKLLGTWMITAAWLAALGLLTFFFSGWMEKQHNPNQEIAGAVRQDGTHEVLLKQNRQGHYVATGAINRQQTRYLLDTGATTVAVPEALAR